MKFLTSLRVIFLGTAGGIPTSRRGLTAILVKRGNEQILFDCGEGTQRQMIIAGGSFHSNMKVFVTHMHGDHVLGLPGLIQTMSLLRRDKKLEIYGPPGLRAFMECIRGTVQFGLTFPIEVREVSETGVACEEREYLVECVPADHTIPSLAYALVEKPRSGKFYPEKAKALGIPEGPLWGKLQHGEEIKLDDGRVIKPEEVTGPSRPGRKIVYTGDTRPCRALTKIAWDADLLIHEATFGDELAERAKEDGHSTPSQAAKLAKKSKVKRLVLTHLSARYEDASMILEQGRKIFNNTIVAEDLMEIEIPFSEK
ncbi:MAG: ribonuclease Z [Candidatus Bathyarchaeota archaeon]|nr:ribonuclease Z [Candidatus Bathyarchaeota archaeon]MCX8176940.1 ribonuclease Z [Candidatus Bathyarchaeota archaeon]MDW8193373.1 ribonuclease Z [Nitrososphaerota archaeon]